jgi:FSR family fosmidomycin resistance protein-like MFS transporter
VAAVFLSCVGMASSFAMLVALLMLGGIGAAAFHPQGAILAGDLSPRRSLAMAIFVTGGTIGFSFGPLYAVSVAGTFGLERTWLAAAPGILVGVVLLLWFARVPARPRHAGAPPGIAGLRPVARPLALLYGAVVARSAASYGFMVFLPLHLRDRGFSVAAGGYVTTLYLLLGGLGGLLGGWLADRWGGRRVVMTSFAGAAPLYLLFLVLPDRAAIASLVLGSFVLQTSLPVNVVMGQELSPRHASTISSLLMGAAWGVGALLIGPIGALADARGLTTALLALTVVLPLGLTCAFALPEPRHGALPAEMAQPPPPETPSAAGPPATGRAPLGRV